MSLNLWSKVALTGAGVLMVVSLSACVSPGSRPTPIPSASPGSQSAGSSGIPLTCAVVSGIETTALNARTGYAQGKITAAEYVGAINTIPPQYNALTFQANYGLRDLVAAAKEAVAKTAPTVNGATFNPDGQPYRQAADALAAACNRGHATLRISSPYGG